MARNEGIGSLETLFKALGDRTRLRIMGLLAGGEVCVCDIHESLKIPQPRASRHLAYLRRAGLVEARKKGLWVHYRLAPGADKVIDTILAAVAHGLGHVPAVARDRQRLEKRTGCCAPLLQQILPAAFACCAPQAAGVSVSTSPDPCADGHPHSPDPGSRGESSVRSSLSSRGQSARVDR